MKTILKILIFIAICVLVTAVFLSLISQSRIDCDEFPKNSQCYTNYNLSNVGIGDTLVGYIPNIGVIAVSVLLLGLLIMWRLGYFKENCSFCETKQENPTPTE